MSYHSDHLGSTRVVFDNGRNVLDRVNYLAFGQPWLPSRYYEFNSPGSRYLFNGMENQSEFSLDANDHGARMSFSRGRKMATGRATYLPVFKN